MERRSLANDSWVCVCVDAATARGAGRHCRVTAATARTHDVDLADVETRSRHVDAVRHVNVANVSAAETASPSSAAAVRGTPLASATFRTRPLFSASRRFVHFMRSCSGRRRAERT